MSDVRERLSRLVELAGESAPEQQRALAFELCDLLTDWPERYPAAMREPFEVLLEKVLRRLDATTRRTIGTRLAGYAETALALLNEFYFDMPPDARASILARNAETPEAASSVAETNDEALLVDAARREADFASAFGRVLNIPPATAQRIVDDAMGDALAVACKGARLRRATYSALALLIRGDVRANPDARHRRLSAYETVPEDGARSILAYWRRPHGDTPPLETGMRAA